MAVMRKAILVSAMLYGLGMCAPAIVSSSSASSTPQGPSQLSDPSYGPTPGESDVYATYDGTARPFPGNITGAVLNITTGPPGADDLLFQNLLSAEWIIFSFYQQGVERFSASSFMEAGFPNTTYERIQQIRDNEAGHLRIFQDQISPTSIKPGACLYAFPYDDPASFLVLQTIIEISSMAFLTGLELQARLDTSRAALVAIAATESRHNTWSLIENWNSAPFAGPSDTIFPYANQILDFTNEWVVEGSCPPQNPVFPSPRQHLPQMTPAKGTKSILPGSELVVSFTQPDNQPRFADKDYHAVFFHGVSNISVPFDMEHNSTTIPESFDALGIIIAIIADAEGAPTKESVVAGPLILPQSPAVLSEIYTSG